MADPDPARRDPEPHPAEEPVAPEPEAGERPPGRIDPGRAAGGAGPGASASGRAPRRLRRSVRDRMIAGVAAGIGHYVGVDPVVVRLAFVLLTLAGGSGILLYLVAALVMPEEDPTHPVADDADDADERARGLARVLGWVLIVAGAIVLVGKFFPLAEQLIWPAALIGLGAAVLVQGGRDRRSS